MSLFAFLACGPDAADPASPQTDTGVPEVEVPLHEVWGPATAEDVDPDPHVVEVHLEAGEAEVDWVDAGPTSVWAYNGQVPGPLIHARVGDTLRVVFENDLDDETTIHWHGLRIPDDQDGVTMMMDAIQPGESFTYEYTLPDAGSFWYHPHVRADEQIERGLQGVMVVDEAEPPAVDRDRYFVIDDVLLKDDGRIEGGFANPDGMTVMMGRYGNTLLTNGSTEILSDTVAPGSVERWRVVNTANARAMYVDVKGADWRVVASDGGILEESYTAGKVLVPPGQRYDFEVKPEADATNVTMEIVIGSGGGERFTVFDATVAGDPVPEHDVDWDPAALPAIVEADQEVELALNADTSTGEMLWTINGETYDPMEAIAVEGRVPTRITIKEKSGIDHPFHIHGQFFQIVSREGVPADEPGFKDTVYVEGKTSVELYTEFENPGAWMAHCHILEHAEAGMMTEIDVGE